MLNFLKFQEQRLMESLHIDLVSTAFIQDLNSLCIPKQLTVIHKAQRNAGDNL